MQLHHFLISNRLVLRLDCYSFTFGVVLRGLGQVVPSFEKLWWPWNTESFTLWLFFSPSVAEELSSCANVLELTRTKQGPFTLEEHALPEDRWTIEDIAQSLEHCSSLLPADLALKKSKPEESNEQVLSCEYITLNETKGEDTIKAS